MRSKMYVVVAVLGICALLAPSAISAKNQVQRSVKFQGRGIMVVGLADGRYQAIESGQSTHLGRYQNEYTGYFDLENLVFLSGSGAQTAANGDLLFWQVSASSGAGVVTGGTGRFEGATGAITWVTTDVVISVDLNSMTMMITYSYTGAGTITY